MPPWLLDAIRFIIFFGGGIVVSRWLIVRPPDELVPNPEMELLRPDEYPPLEFNPHNPPAGFTRNTEMPHAGRKLIALWVWLFVANASGCTIGAEHARQELATMPTAMALREMRQERERLRDRYGDAFIEAEMQHWREQQ